MTCLTALLIVVEASALTGALLGAWSLGDTVLVSVAVTFGACATILRGTRRR